MFECNVLCKRVEARNRNPFTWVCTKHRRISLKLNSQIVFAFVVVGAVASFVTIPRGCVNPECVSASDQGQDPVLNGWNAWSTPQSRSLALFVLFLKESVSLVLAIQESRHERHAAVNFPDPVLPLALICTVLSLLALTELLFMFDYRWRHASPPALSRGWSQVFTLRYLEWMINVPILLVLAGHCVLDRPFSEVMLVVIVTDAYMYVAWLALVMHDTASRVFLAILSFVGYFVATYMMALWVCRFWVEASPHTPRRPLRVILAALLMSIFGLYGCIYLFSFIGVITFEVEHELYAVLDLNTKLAVSCIIGSLRSAERQFALCQLTVDHMYLNNGFMSLLRSTFDYVISCRLDELGRCLVPEVNSTDIKALEALVGRPVSGIDFTELLLTDAGRVQFQEHIRDTVEHMRDAVDTFAGRLMRTSSLSLDSVVPSMDPQASFQHAPEMAMVRLYDIVRPADSNGVRCIRMCAHISTTPISSDNCRQLILALRGSNQNSYDEFPEPLSPDYHVAGAQEIVWVSQGKSSHVASESIDVESHGVPARTSTYQS